MLRVMLSSERLQRALYSSKYWAIVHRKSYNVQLCIPPLGTYLGKNEICPWALEFTSPEHPIALKDSVGACYAIEPELLEAWYLTKGNQPVLYETLLKSKSRWVTAKHRVDYDSYYVFHVPLSVSGQVTDSWGNIQLINDTSLKVPHNCGDVLICPSGGRMPDISQCRLLNGEKLYREYTLGAELAPLYSNTITNKIKDSYVAKYSATYCRDNKEVSSNG